MPWPDGRSRTLGLGNAALVKRPKAQLGETEGRRGLLVNRIDREVADAYNLSSAGSAKCRSPSTDADGSRRF